VIPVHEMRVGMLEWWTRARAKAIVLEASVLALAVQVSLWWVFPAWVASSTSTLLGRFSSQFGGGDLLGTLFLVQRSANGEWGCRSEQLGVPFGFDLCGDFPNPMFTDLLGVLAGLFGMPLGYNLGLFLVFLTNAWSVQLAVRILGGRAVPAALAGCLTAGIPLVGWEMIAGRPVTAAWGASVAGAAFCVAAVRSDRDVHLAVPGAICLALGTAVYAYGPLMLLPWAILAAAGPLRCAWKRVSLVLGMAALGAVPPAVVQVLRRSDLQPDGELARVLQAPQIFGWENLFALSVNLGGDAVVPGSLGVLALAACVLARRQWREWFAAFVAGLGLLVLSTGPSLLFSSMEALPGLPAVPQPIRFALPGAFLVVVGVGQAASAVWSDHRKTDPLIGCLALLFVYGQVRCVTDDGLTRWPLQEDQVVGQAQLALDIPLVLNDPNFPWFFYVRTAIPRLNPPRWWPDARLDGEEGQRWREQVKERELYLVQAVVQQTLGMGNPRELVGRFVERQAERDELGLDVVLVHQDRIPTADVNAWENLLRQAGLIKTGSMGSTVVWRWSERTTIPPLLR
jgi:hypothetical protein